MAKIKPLKLNKLCRNFTFREIAVLAQYINEHEYKKDDVIFSEGDSGEHVYLVSNGEVGIKSEVLTNGESALNLSSGDYFGELSLFEAGPRRATAFALADTTILLSIARKDFETMCAEEPFVSYKLIREVIGVFSSKLRDGQKELTELLAAKGK